MTSTERQRRHQRTSSQITADVLTKRLGTHQLLPLLDLKEFSFARESIISKLSVIGGLNPAAFRKVHSVCGVREDHTGETVRFHGVDIDFGSWSQSVDTMKLTCSRHHVSSERYVHWQNEILPYSSLR